MYMSEKNPSEAEFDARWRTGGMNLVDDLPRSESPIGIQDEAVAAVEGVGGATARETDLVQTEGVISREEQKRIQDEDFENQLKVSEIISRLRRVDMPKEFFERFKLLDEQYCDLGPNVKHKNARDQIGAQLETLKEELIADEKARGL